MSIITDITTQKRKTNIYNVFVDGKFSFSLGDTDISSLGLHINQELSEQEIIDLQTRSSYAKAYARSLDYLSRRSRSIDEMTKYLLRKEFSLDAVGATIEKLKNKNYLNDEEFAQVWVKNRTLLKPRSIRQLKVELRQKGIDKDIVDATLQDYDENMELESAKTLVRKKNKNPTYADTQKLMQYLLRQGFSYVVVKKAIELSALENKA